MIKASLMEDNHTDYEFNFIEELIMYTCDCILENIPIDYESIPEQYRNLIMAAGKIMAKDETGY